MLWRVHCLPSGQQFFIIHWIWDAFIRQLWLISQAFLEFAHKSQLQLPGSKSQISTTLPFHCWPKNQFPQAVILAPTREIAMQISDELERLAWYLDPPVDVQKPSTGRTVEKTNGRTVEFEDVLSEYRHSITEDLNSLNLPIYELCVSVYGLASILGPTCVFWCWGRLFHWWRAVGRGWGTIVQQLTARGGSELSIPRYPKARKCPEMCWLESPWHFFVSWKKTSNRSNRNPFFVCFWF